jgi:hypothetical protein
MVDTAASRELLHDAITHVVTSKVVRSCPVSASAMAWAQGVLE